MSDFLCAAQVPPSRMLEAAALLTTLGPIGCNIAIGSTTTVSVLHAGELGKFRKSFSLLHMHAKLWQLQLGMSHRTC